MANTTDVDDIREEALERVGENGSDSSGDFYSIALTFLIEKFFEIYFHKPWRFTIADPPGAFATVAPITSLTVSVTLASTSATLSASQTADLVNRKIKIGNNVYRISVHGGSSAAITLDQAYIEATDGTAACTIYQDEYSLSASDFGRVIRVRDMRTGKTLTRKGVDHPDIRIQQANPSQGIAGLFALITDSKIIFDSYAQDARRYEYDYQKQPTDPAAGGAIDLPRRWRPVLRNATAAALAMDKDDDRADGLETKYFNGLERMEREEFWDASLGGIGPSLIV